MHKLTHRNSGAVMVCLQFGVKLRRCIVCDKIISQKWSEKEPDNKAFLHSIVWQYNKIWCSIFSHKFPVRTVFIVEEMPGKSV